MWSKLELRERNQTLSLSSRRRTHFACRWNTSKSLKLVESVRANDVFFSRKRRTLNCSIITRLTLATILFHSSGNATILYPRVFHLSQLTLDRNTTNDAHAPNIQMGRQPTTMTQMQKLLGTRHAAQVSPIHCFLPGALTPQVEMSEPVVGRRLIQRRDRKLYIWSQWNEIDWDSLSNVHMNNCVDIEIISKCPYNLSHLIEYRIASIINEST